MAIPTCTTVPLELGPRPSSNSAAAARGSEGLGLRHWHLALGTGGDRAHGSAPGSLQSEDGSPPPSLPPAPLPGLPGRLLPLLYLLPPPAAALRRGVRRSPAQSRAGAQARGGRAGGRSGAAGAAVPAPRALRPTSRAAARWFSPPASPGAVGDSPRSERPASFGARRRRRAAGTVRSGRGGRGSGLGAPRALRRWLLRRGGGCAFARAASCSFFPDSCCLFAAPSTSTWTVLPSTPAPKEVTSASRWISSCPARLRKWPHLEGESAPSPTARAHPAFPGGDCPSPHPHRGFRFWADGRSGEANPRGTHRLLSVPPSPLPGRTALKQTCASNSGQVGKQQRLVPPDSAPPLLASRARSGSFPNFFFLRYQFAFPVACFADLKSPPPHFPPRGLIPFLVRSFSRHSDD